eukprot:1864779-Pleurochrysis_carterae.AAC.1
MGRNLSSYVQRDDVFRPRPAGGTGRTPRTACVALATPSQWVWNTCASGATRLPMVDFRRRIVSRVSRKVVKDDGASYLI